MGVSGSGKTTIGKLLAESLQWEFSDADSFHSADNVEKMRSGIPLSEADRMPWLEALQTAIKHWLEANKNVVLACSALKDSYRQLLISANDASKIEDFPSHLIQIVYLKGSFQLIQKRLKERQNHYMSEKLLNSQFGTLEEPLNAISIDIQNPPEVIAKQIKIALNL
jgi:gluconokinase